LFAVNTGMHSTMTIRTQRDYEGWMVRAAIASVSGDGSRALRADAVEAITCGWLSFVVVVSLTAQWLTGAWWIDSVGALAIVWFLIKEGREVWSADECEACCS
jgi:divalent metal cation (Fe/Co/Zn/Cd) transporter